MDKSEEATKNSTAVQSASSSSEQRTLTIPHALDLAIQHHAAGDLPKAEDIYQKILQTNPNQPEALHLHGMITHQELKMTAFVVVEFYHAFTMSCVF